MKTLITAAILSATLASCSSGSDSGPSIAPAPMQGSVIPTSIQEAKGQWRLARIQLNYDDGEVVNNSDFTYVSGNMTVTPAAGSDTTATYSNTMQFSINGDTGTITSTGTFVLGSNSSNGSNGFFTDYDDDGSVYSGTVTFNPAGSLMYIISGFNDGIEYDTWSLITRDVSSDMSANN